jgi:tRNA(His) guanylyltransferase
LSVADKNNLLFEQGINYNDLPAWQKRGVGFGYRMVTSSPVNPVARESVDVTRRKLQIEMNLPLGAEYDSMLRRLLTASENVAVI